MVCGGFIYEFWLVVLWGVMGLGDGWLDLAGTVFVLLVFAGCVFVGWLVYALYEEGVRRDREREEHERLQRENC